MRKFIQDYRDTRQPTDDFITWFLVRKLNVTGKLLFALFLWVVWLKFAFNLRFMFFSSNSY